MALQLAIERAQASSPDRDLATALEITMSVGRGVDVVAWQLRPAVLDDLGLAAAIPRVVNAWSARTGVRAFYRVDDHAAEMLSPDAALAFYRILQESLDNAARHARAHRVDVVLSTDGTRVVLVIEDDGVGFDVGATEDAHAQPGLDGMFERAALVDATLEVESILHKGTSIFLRQTVQPSPR